MKDLFDKLIDTANAKVTLERDAEQRKADELARAKAEGQKLADAYCEKHQPMFAAAIAAMQGRGILASSQRKTGGILVVFDALETDAALRTLASSFEYSYYQDGIHISEIVCGQAPVTRNLTYSDLKDVFIAWMTMAIEARGSCPVRPRF